MACIKRCTPLWLAVPSAGCVVWLWPLLLQAYTPWEWQPKLKELANSLGMDLFSSPFDHSAVDFLEAMNVPAYKIASFEVNDLPLLRKVCQQFAAQRR